MAAGKCSSCPLSAERGVGGKLLQDSWDDYHCHQTAWRHHSDYVHQALDRRSHHHYHPWYLYDRVFSRKVQEERECNCYFLGDHLQSDLYLFHY